MKYNRAELLAVSKLVKHLNPSATEWSEADIQNRILEQIKYLTEHKDIHTVATAGFVVNRCRNIISINLDAPLLMRTLIRRNSKRDLDDDLVEI